MMGIDSDRCLYKRYAIKINDYILVFLNSRCREHAPCVSAPGFTRNDRVDNKCRMHKNFIFYQLVQWYSPLIFNKTKDKFQELQLMLLKDRKDQMTLGKSALIVEFTDIVEFKI